MSAALSGELNPTSGLYEGGQRVPAFFIDSLTRDGMSGSPVVCRRVGGWKEKQRDGSEITINGTAHDFIGVYSGRLPGREFEAALGLCWKAALVEEICADGVLSRHPYYFGGK